MGLRQLTQNQLDARVQLHCQHQRQRGSIKAQRWHTQHNQVLRFRLYRLSMSSCHAGSTQALFVLTKFHNSKFEFIFTNFVRDSPRLFATIQTVFRAYDTSRMYRDLKLRGAVISDKELKLLPQEQVYSQVSCLNSFNELLVRCSK